MKKIVIFVFVCLFLSFSLTSVLASEKEVDIKKANISGSIDVSDKVFNEILTKNEPVYLGDDTWAEAISEEEMVSIIAKNRRISKQVARNQLLDTSKSEITTMSTAAVAYRYIHYYRSYPIYGWTPQIDVYVKAYAYENAFVSIVDLNLNRSYAGVSKVFKGKLEAKMETNKRIYYVINGDFYNNGSISTTRGGSINSQYLSYTYSVTSSSNHWGYLYKTGYLNMR